MMHKSNSTLLLSFLITLTLTSCVSTHVVNLQSYSDKNIEVYTTIKPVREYVELKYIQIDGSIFTKPEKLLTKLIERAKKEGADAVINVRFDNIELLPYVSGTAIKYKTQ